MSVADLAPGQHASQVRNYWWWRPGWRVGRYFYALHITLGDQPNLCQLADTYRKALARRATFATLTPIPDRWLHLTMQGIGFADEISPATAERIADQVRSILAGMPSFQVAFDEAIIADEAIVLPAEPPEPVRELRAATREAIGLVLGPDHVPENPNRYRPHVSIAYITAAGPAEPYVTAVRSARVEPVQSRIDHVDLIQMHRDRRMYEWSVVDRIPLR